MTYFFLKKKIKICNVYVDLKSRIVIHIETIFCPRGDLQSGAGASSAHGKVYDNIVLGIQENSLGAESQLMSVLMKLTVHEDALQTTVRFVVVQSRVGLLIQSGIGVGRCRAGLVTANPGAKTHSTTHLEGCLRGTQNLH